MACDWNGVMARLERRGRCTDAQLRPRQGRAIYTEEPMRPPRKHVRTSRKRSQVPSWDTTNSPGATLDDVPQWKKRIEDDYNAGVIVFRDRVKEILKPYSTYTDAMRQILGFNEAQIRSYKSNLSEFLAGRNSRGTRVDSSWVASAMLVKVYHWEHHVFPLEQWQLDALDALCELRAMPGDDFKRAMTTLEDMLEGAKKRASDDEPPRRPSSIDDPKRDPAKDC